MSIGVLLVLLAGLCESAALGASGDVDLTDLPLDGILSTILKVSYSLQMEAKSLVSEAENIRSEAQAMRAEATDSRQKAEVMKRDAEAIRDEVDKMLEDIRGLVEEGKNSMNQAFEVISRPFTFFGQEGSGDRCSDVEDVINAVKEDTSASFTMLSSISARFENIDRNITEIRNLDEFEDIKNRLGSLESAITTLDEKVVGSSEEAQEKFAEMQTASENLIGMSAQLTELGSTLQSIDEKVKDSNQKTSSLAVKLEEHVSLLGTQVEGSKVLMQTVKSRLQSWMSEIRIISLFKMTEDSNPHQHYETGVITDGQVGFSDYRDYVMRVYSARASASADEKMWIKLGGLFRVHKILVWNARNPREKPRFQGTRILVDDTYIGTGVGVSDYYHFDVHGEVYGSHVILHQPRPTDMNVIEVQVWGCGPFSPNDKFA